MKPQAKPIKEPINVAVNPKYTYENISTKGVPMPMLMLSIAIINIYRPQTIPSAIPKLHVLSLELQHAPLVQQSFLPLSIRYLHKI
jgi:hypothetical protein